MCGYCDFYRSVKLQFLPRVVEMMHTELEQERDFLHDKSLRTIYFGGGTPSLLRPSEIERLIDHARALFDCSQVEEITIEVNPDDITPDYVAQLRQTSVNRISMGVQSLDDGVLQFMGRRHSAEQALGAVRLLKEAGYDNISVDLIFGVEVAGAEVLEKTLQGFLALGVQHISAYHLTIEENTRFGKMLSRGELHEVEEERSEAEFLQVHRALTDAGYQHYEVSNYALEGYRSRHNSSYWRGVEYLGIGPGAHSFNGAMRRWCEQRVENYVDGVVYESEVLTDGDRFNEYVMTSLRCVEGLSLERVRSEFGEGACRHIESEASKMGIEELLVREGDNFRIRPERMLLSDLVIEALMRF